MSLLLILKNNSNKNLIDHLWKKIGNKLITLKITTKKKKKKEEKEESGAWAEENRHFLDFCTRTVL